MNDPHVVALHYRVEHDSTYDYDGVPPLYHQVEAFDIRIENKQASFTMKEHYATEEEARKAIEEYIRSWELDAVLRQGLRTFKLRFDRAKIVDRNPTPATPGTVIGRGRPTHVIVTASKARLVISPASYPSPPSRRLKLSPDVRSMLHRFSGFCEGKEPLPGMAYFCLTVLQASARGRKTAAVKYGINRAVLDRVGCLSSSNGGEGARKADGTRRDFLDGDRQFLEAAVKAFIRRVAEVAHDSSAIRPEITMSCFQGS